MPLSSLKPLLPKHATDHVCWGQLHGSSQFLVLAQTLESHEGVSLVITPDMQSAYQMEEALRFFAKDKNIHIFPDWETLPYDVFSPLEDIVSDRLKTLSLLPQNTHGVLIVSSSTLMHRLPPSSFVSAHALTLNVGDCLDIELLREELDRAGYRHVTQVFEHGEYATRGSLIDLFPMGSTTPYRIDLFDDEIETIRSFDPENQRSLEQHSAIELLPAHEFPLTEAGIQRFSQNYRTQLEGDLTKSVIYQNVKKGLAPAGVEYYLPLFFEDTATLFDYLPHNTLVIQQESVSEALSAFTAKVTDRYEQRRHDIERPILPPEKLFISEDSLKDKIQSLANVHLHSFKQEENCHNYPVSPLPSLLIQPRAETPLLFLKQFMAEHEGSVLFIAESAGRREELSRLLKNSGFTPHTVESWQTFLKNKHKIAITVAPLQEGMLLKEEQLAIIPESLIIGQHVQQQRRRRKPTRDADAIVRNLTDLNEGSPVVHEEHGVGRYIGMQKIQAGANESEYLTLEYSGGDKLYVPVSSLHLISRYTGTSPENAPLHKLGTDHWDKARKKAAQKAYDAAAELLEIHARRAAEKGHSFGLDLIDYNLFSNAFPFEETPDQLTAIESVISDMQSTQPMDRVVCGDVGFGKTEVAMRAAFVAANAGKQVAIIAPTTLLVQQHFQNFQDRFADWPFSIDSLSRFRTPKQTREALDKLANGTLDIVIGTHKLLQKDVNFKRLGLVIIDEEHRFGVRHKEQLKKLRANVDLLTLTATPIPRTLNMSLSGLRDLSIIATPPMARHAVKTFVNEWDKSIIQEACSREISRGGQVYFLHNEVKTIEKITKELSDILPDINVRFAHGQMRERELEAIMEDFYHQRFHVLVATTIIESGIDIPTANTILINRADKLGLAQLHQLRGRVGRSHHRAYAYLITPPFKGLTADAKKRLEAIESLEDLGVGFTLASHDLEIRGAGELLGDDQSGQIQEIGFSMYNDLLERAVNALKSGHLPDLEKPAMESTTIDLGSPALIPDDYLPDVHNRLIMYKRIASAETKEKLRELKVEMIDRFGMFPEPINNLFHLTDLKLASQTLGIKKLDLGISGGRIIFHATPKIDIGKLITLIQKRPWEFKLDGQDKLKFEYEAKEDIEERVQWVKRLYADLS